MGLFKKKAQTCDTEVLDDDSSNLNSRHSLGGSTRMVVDGHDQTYENTIRQALQASREVLLRQEALEGRLYAFDSVVRETRRREEFQRGEIMDVLEEIRRGVYALLTPDTDKAENADSQG